MNVIKDYKLDKSDKYHLPLYQFNVIIVECNDDCISFNSLIQLKMYHTQGHVHISFVIFKYTSQYVGV